MSTLLNVYWLRPETAMWRELDIKAMAGFDFKSPSLDIGRGDGLFSFIRAGGVCHPSFDAFKSIYGLDRFFDNIDVYDSATTLPKHVVLWPAQYSIDYGIDHKINLLNKAKVLGFYRNLMVVNANDSLPFNDASFASVFSNIVYWLDDPSHAISETYRVLKPGGQACLMLPNVTLPKYSFYYSLHVKNQDERWAFLDLLDRGRFAENIKHSRSSDQWQTILNDSGLILERHTTHLSHVAVKAWDIGLRPLFPVLRKMVEHIPENCLNSIKGQWVDILKHFVSNLVNLDGQLSFEDEPAFHCFLVRK